MTDDRRYLQVIRDGRKWKAEQPVLLPIGAQGNRETVAHMCRIVLEDSVQPDVRVWALRTFIGIENKTVVDQINAAFRYCRDAIVYRDEGPGTETVADLWSCNYALDKRYPTGDCAIKSTALATLLAIVGVTPSFVIIRQVPNVDWFNHVYVQILVDGSETVLDPTPENFRPGDSQPFLEREVIPIF